MSILTQAAVPSNPALEAKFRAISDFGWVTTAGDGRTLQPLASAFNVLRNSMSLKHSHHHPKPHHSNIGAAALTRSQVSKRRSSRMSLNASVGLSGEDRLKVTFTMSAKATNLNRHGAAVQLSRDLPVGSVVTLKNQRGEQVTARIVSVIAVVQGVSTYGVEFVDKENDARQFWGISFPTNS